MKLSVVGVQGILNCRENSGMEKEYTANDKAGWNAV